MYKMPELTMHIEVYCGICGHGCCSSTDIDGYKVTVTCPDCEDKIADLKDEVQTLQNQIEKYQKEV
jgi:hypothetical protein